MRFVLLCPGPTLNGFDPAKSVAVGDHVIGVDRAAKQHRCDIWACTDYPLLEKIREMVLDEPHNGLPPILLTAASAAAWLEEHSIPWHGLTVLAESCYPICDPVWRWDKFTPIAALVYASRLGARQIDVYGADWSEEEEHILEVLIIPWLKTRGCRVAQH